jgi:hypothetical protein
MITSIQACPAEAVETEPEYVLAPNVIFLTVEDGSGRLVDMTAGFHAVPAMGTRMLQETLSNGAAAAAARIAKDYGVAPQQVENDLAAFLYELESQRLLYSRRTRRGGRQHGTSLARALIRPGLYAAHRFLRSPAAKARALQALARLSFALFGWTRTVAVWQEAHAEFPARDADERDADTIVALREVVCTAAATNLVAAACKERALCSWSLARAAGLHASIVVGVFLFPIAAHCWCEAGTETLSDDRERCDQFTPVARW